MVDWAAVAYTAAALLCAAAATVIALGHIYRHLLHYAEPIFQRFIVRIIFMVPVYAVMSFISLILPDNAIYFTSIREMLSEWREPAARAGGDEVLQFVLSWYEDINLDAVQTLRVGSKWITDPEHIRRRQERAYSLVEYAAMHSFHDNPFATEETEKEAEEGADTEEAEGGTGQDDAGLDPKTGTDAPVPSTSAPEPDTRAPQTGTDAPEASVSAP